MNTTLSHESDIQRLIESLGAAFGALDFDAWVELFHLPHTIVMPDSVFSSDSTEKTRAAMLPLFESVNKRGFTHTVLETCNIKLLSDNTALVGTVWSRFAGEELLEQIGATYFVMNNGAGWKAVMVTAHGPDVLAVAG